MPSKFRHRGLLLLPQHSRYFWGPALYLLRAPNGSPIAFEVAATA